jgi:hypothetical protein
MTGGFTRFATERIIKTCFAALFIAADHRRRAENRARIPTFFCAALSQSVRVSGLFTRKNNGMETFEAVLYIHVIATLGLVAAMGAEALIVRQLRRTTQEQDSVHLASPAPAIGIAASVCLLVLLLSGGYLTDRSQLWTMAWPKIAVAIVITFGALGGLSNRRLRKVIRSSTEVQSQAPFLATSLGIRTGLVLAAVWLMTAKPGFVESLAVALVSAGISWWIAALIGRKAGPDSAAAPNSNLQHSPR